MTIATTFFDHIYSVSQFWDMDEYPKIPCLVGKMWRADTVNKMTLYRTYINCLKDIKDKIERPVQCASTRVMLYRGLSSVFIVLI